MEIKKGALKFSIIIISLTISLISITCVLKRGPFIKTESILNMENQSISVNNEVILLRNYLETYLVSKKSAKKMDLGTEIKIPYSDENDDCMIMKDYIVNPDTIIETYFCGDYYYQTKYDVLTYNEVTIRKKMPYKELNSNINYYNQANSSLFGDSNQKWVFNDFYSTRWSDLYKKDKKISVENLMGSRVSIDNEEVFYITTNFNLMSYKNDNTVKVIDGDAQMVSVTKRYIYYWSRLLDKTIKINRENYEIQTELISGFGSKIRDYRDYTLICNGNELIIIKGDRIVKTFDEVTDFDIDDRNIYTTYNCEYIEVIDILTMEKELFWYETGA